MWLGDFHINFVLNQGETTWYKHPISIFSSIITINLEYKFTRFFEVMLPSEKKKSPGKIDDEQKHFILFIENWQSF